MSAQTSHAALGSIAVCATSATAAAGSDDSVRDDPVLASITESTTSTAQNPAASAASAVRPKTATHATMSSAVTASTSGYSGEIARRNGGSGRAAGRTREPGCCRARGSRCRSSRRTTAVAGATAAPAPARRRRSGSSRARAPERRRWRARQRSRETPRSGHDAARRSAGAESSGAGTGGADGGGVDVLESDARSLLGVVERDLEVVPIRRSVRGVSRST